MSILEITLTSITTILTGSNILLFISMKAQKRQQEAIADHKAATATEKTDSIIYHRLEFLENKYNKMESLLEKYGCIQLHCKDRISPFISLATKPKVI